MGRRNHFTKDAYDLLLEQEVQPSSPERILLCAIIQLACDDLNGKRKLSAMHFFCSQSFNMIACLLSLDADAIRKRLVPTEMQQQLAAKPYTMPVELRPKKIGRPGNGNSTSWYQRKRLQQQKQQNDEADIVIDAGLTLEQLEQISEPESEPIAYKQQFNSRSIRNDDHTAAL